MASLDGFGKSGRTGGNVVENPVDPCHFRRCRIRGIRIVDDKNDAICSLGKARLFKGRGNVIPIAREDSRDLSVMRKSLGCHCHGHGRLSFFGVNMAGTAFRRVSIDARIQENACKAAQTKHDKGTGHPFHGNTSQQAMKSVQSLLSGSRCPLTGGATN